MGAYAVRCYKSTGFDGVNIPDSLDLLNQFAYKDYGNVSLRQERFLSFIRLNDTWNNVSDYDYVKIGTDSNAFYYSCQPTMIADDVVELTLLPDWVLSAGGIEKALAYVIGGMTDRITPTDDTMGYYEESDALLAPSLPLNLMQQWHNPGSTADTTYLESTVDIVRTGTNALAKTYTDDDGNTVTIPTAVYIKQKIGDLVTCPGTTYSLSGLTASTNPATQVYEVDNNAQAAGATYTVSESIANGMQIVRTIGLESAIISYYKIPTKYATPTKGTTRAVIDGSVTYSDQVVTTMTGNTGSFDSGIPYNYILSSQQSNAWNRLLTSEYTKFGIVSASGESCEYNPAEILQSGNSANARIRWIADPRPDGKPYFRFVEVNSDASTGANFFRSCISGLKWKQVPLLYTSVSGSALNTLKYDNSRRLADTNYSYGMQKLEMEQDFRGTNLAFNQTRNAVTSAVGAAAGLLTKGPFGVADAATSITNGVFNAIGQGINYHQESEYNALDQQKMTAMYQAQRNQELSALAVQNTIAVPTVTIPYNSEVIRDFYGNGCLVYRYTYDDRDLTRINKILTMYGYKHTKPVEASDFNGHQKFDYVACKGLSVTGLPKYWCNGLTAQLTNGVRVWHVKPSPTHYNGKLSNPNK